MYTLNRVVARKILTSEMNFQPLEADIYLDRFPDLDERLGKSVDAWLHDRTIIDLDVEGISVQQVMKNYNTHFLSAVKMLNDLLTRHLDSKEREALKNSLRKPPIKA